MLRRATSQTLNYQGRRPAFATTRLPIHISPPGGWRGGCRGKGVAGRGSRVGSGAPGGRASVRRVELASGCSAGGV
eukprot:scaffold62974_cov65-Phaeocystis_antarctica.AAC.1